MSYIDELLSEYLQLKSESDLLKNQLEDKRLSIYNELTNLQQDSYSNELVMVNKINDSEYLSISKQSFFDAANKANLTDSQKQILFDSALKEFTKSSYIIIKEK